MASIAIILQTQLGGMYPEVALPLQHLRFHKKIGATKILENLKS